MAFSVEQSGWMDDAAHAEALRPVSALECAALSEFDQLLGPEDLYLSREYRRMSSSASERLTRLVEDKPIWGVWRLSDETEAPDKFLRADRVIARNSECNSISVSLPVLTVSPRAAANTHLVASPDACLRDYVGAIRRLEELALSEGARSVAFPYVYGTQGLLRSALHQCGYSTQRADDAFVLDLSFSTFDDYLASLSRHRRSEIRRERRRIVDAGVTVDSLPFERVDLAELARLECSLQTKYNRPRSPADVINAMHTLGAAIGRNMVVHVAQLDGDIIGFAMVVYWRGGGYPRWVGFDYQRQGSLPVYFEVVFYRTIEVGLERGARRIDYAIGSEAAKESRGCRRVEQWSHWRLLSENT